mgnify:CR=1 FL=1
MESEANVHFQILGAARCGVKNSVIARSFNVHRSTVYRVLAQYRERGTVVRKVVVGLAKLLQEQIVFGW